jgi:hypothetical protein
VVPAGKRRFLGLGRGYLIYGPEELFTLPGRNRAVDLTTGLWGIFMPGLMQLITGTYLFVGLTWFDSFREKPLYMAARAFGGDPRPNGFMSVAFALVSVLGVIVFFKTSDAPVGGPFIGLTCINVNDFFASLFRHAPGSTQSRVHPASRSRPRSASWASARRRSSPRHRQGVACTVPATRPRPRGTS